MSTKADTSEVREQLAEIREEGPRRALGVRKVIRALARKYRRADSIEGLIRAASELWKGGGEEERDVALGALVLLSKHLEQEHWPLFKDWIERAKLPRQVDLISRDLLGALLRRDRSWLRVLKHWALSKQVRQRRAAVLAVVPRARRMGDVEAALEIAEGSIQDAAPEVQEALAELLQEASASHAGAVQDFLGRWGRRLPPPVRRLLHQGASL